MNARINAGALRSPVELVWLKTQMHPRTGTTNSRLNIIRFLSIYMTRFILRSGSAWTAFARMAPSALTKRRMQWPMSSSLWRSFPLSLPNLIAHLITAFKDVSTCVPKDDESFPRLLTGSTIWVSTIWMRFAAHLTGMLRLFSLCSSFSKLGFPLLFFWLLKENYCVLINLTVIPPTRYSNRILPPLRRFLRNSVITSIFWYLSINLRFFESSAAPVGCSTASSDIAPAPSSPTFQSLPSTSTHVSVSSSAIQTDISRLKRHLEAL